MAYNNAGRWTHTESSVSTRAKTLATLQLAFTCEWGCTVGNALLRPQECTKFQMCHHCLQRCYMLSPLKAARGDPIAWCGATHLPARTVPAAQDGRRQRRLRRWCAQRRSLRGRGRASQHAPDSMTMAARRKGRRRGSQAVALKQMREQCSPCKGPFCEHFDGALLTSGVIACKIHPRS